MRGVPRWIAVLAVVATGAVVCAFTVRRAMAPATLILQLSQTTVPADGFTSTELKITPSNGRPLRDLQVTVEDPHRAVVESVTVDGDTATASLRAGVLPGATKVRVTRSRLRGTSDRIPALCSTPVTRSETALRTSCACTIPLTALLSADGLPSWLRRSISADERFLRKLTIAPRCCASPTAKPCGRTMRCGRTRWHCRLQLRQATSSNINTRTRRWQQHYFACVVGAFRPTISATAPSRSSRMWKRFGGITRTLSDTTWLAPGPVICCSFGKTVRGCHSTR